ncbi:hypothetical protein P9112_010469 [Eukaryota sp. TZLM1-RC]
MTHNNDRFPHTNTTPSCSQTERHCQCFTNSPFHVLANPSLTCQSDIPSPETLPHDYRKSLSKSNCSSLIDQNSSHSPFLPPPIDREVGVHSISVGLGYSLLLTYSGEVYGWGDNFNDKVLYNGPGGIISPIKLPLTNIVAISAGRNHSLALSSAGKLYGWGSNNHHQINNSTSRSLPITLINIPYSIKEVFGVFKYSYALTQEGNFVKWGNGQSFELIEDFNNFVFVAVHDDSIIVVDDNGDFFTVSKYGNLEFPEYHVKIPVSEYLIPKAPHQDSFLFCHRCLFVIDTNGVVWKFNKGSDGSFNNKPTKVPGLTNIVSISGNGGFTDIFAAIDNNGKVFVWGKLSRLSDAYQDAQEPICIEAFTNIEGISVGHDFFFAYNKSTVWAWGRNFRGQLGTGDLIERPQPVKVFGSEILGSFRYLRQPLDRMFSGLIKLVYWQYLTYLQKLFGNHPYVKARFYTKCGISKRVAQFAQEVFNVHPIQHTIFLVSSEVLNFYENICDLQMHLTSAYSGPNVINTRIQKLDVYYDEVDYDPQLLSFFPNVEAIKLGGWSKCGSNLSINLTHLSKLKCLELNYSLNIQQLPTSLVKLVLKHNYVQVINLSYLTSLKELIVSSPEISERILKNQIHVPQSIIRLSVKLYSTVNVEIQLLNLKEFTIYNQVPANITEQNFPYLEYIQLIRPREDCLLKSPWSPTRLISRGLIKSVQFIRNGHSIQLSCFPWFIQYLNSVYVTDLFNDFMDENFNPSSNK